MEAMISFLREFQIVQDPSTTTSISNGNGNNNSRSGSISSNVGKNGPQIVNGGRNDNGLSDEIISEPFVPEFVYEAMRLNKRFDTMRVSHT